MQFIKMHALGNDYVYIDCIRQKVEVSRDLVRRMSDRHTGIGSDGVILILPSERRACRMQMFNADGSDAEMCGNGLRCVAKYAYEAGYVRTEEFEIDTAVGPRRVRVQTEGNRVGEVTGSLGRPVFERAEIPMTGQGPAGPVVLPLPEGDVQVTSLSVGNPHTVLFVDELEGFPCAQLGPLIESHEFYPNRTNVEFVQVLSADRLRMRVWERGTGMTLACGTGAAAAVVAAVQAGQSEREATVELPLGQIRIEYPEQGDLLMTGPVEQVFEGTWGPA